MADMSDKMKATVQTARPGTGDRGGGAAACGHLGRDGR